MDPSAPRSHPRRARLGLICLVLLAAACSHTDSYVTSDEASSATVATDPATTARPPVTTARPSTTAQRASTTVAPSTTAAAPTTTSTVATTVAPSTAAPTTAAPLNLPPNDASMSDQTVANQVLGQLGAILGDPAGAQKRTVPGLRGNLQDLLDGKITAEQWFSTSRMPPGTVGANGVTVMWLMCTSSLGASCGGSVGNFVYEMRTCADSPKRVWTTEMVEGPAGFAAAGYCEYEAPPVQLAAALENTANCTAEYLRGRGLSPTRDPALDALASPMMNFDPYDAATRAQLEQQLKAAGAAAYRLVWVPTENLEPGQTSMAGCLDEIGFSFTDQGAPVKDLDGRYGVFVAVGSRQFRAAIVFG